MNPAGSFGEHSMRHTGLKAMAASVVAGAALTGAHAQEYCWEGENRYIAFGIEAIIQSLDPQIHINNYNGAGGFLAEDIWFEIDESLESDVRVRTPLVDRIDPIVVDTAVSRARVWYLQDINTRPMFAGGFTMEFIENGRVRIRVGFETDGSEIKGWCPNCRNQDARAGDANINATEGAYPFVEAVGVLAISSGILTLDIEEVRLAARFDGRGLIPRVLEQVLNGEGVLGAMTSVVTRVSGRLPDASSGIGLVEAMVLDMLQSPEMRAAINSALWNELNPVDAETGERVAALPYTSLHVGPNRSRICRGSPIAAGSEVGVFPTPRLAFGGRDRRVDLCYQWGSQCGQPAADAFCRSEGFARAEPGGFTVAYDVGAADPTLVQGAGRLCAEAACDALANVRCEASGGSTWGRRFDLPRLPGPQGQMRVDWCRSWGANCGEPAADAFCQRMGYREAAEFAIDADIGAVTPTVVMDGGQVCADEPCDGFAYIACTGSSLQ